MNFEQADEFKKELKTLSKKWRSLPKDLTNAQKVIASLYAENPDIDLATYRKAFFDNKRAAILTKTDDGKEVVKMRLDCASLGSKDAIRLVFVCVRAADTITLVELYSKTDKERENPARYRRYL